MNHRIKSSCDDRDWETKRFAVTIICYRTLFESSIINPTILEGFHTIINYSLCCFIDSSYEDMLKRSLDITIAYTEFIKMFKKKNDNIDENLIINDACQFIFQRFPAVNACNDCAISNVGNFIRLQSYIELLTKKLIDKYHIYSKDISKIIDVAREVHSQVEIQ